MARGDPDPEFTPFTLDPNLPAILPRKNYYAYPPMRQANEKWDSGVKGTVAVFSSVQYAKPDSILRAVKAHQVDVKTSQVRIIRFMGSKDSMVERSRIKPLVFSKNTSHIQ